MTASTHNGGGIGTSTQTFLTMPITLAVDNVLERFVKLNKDRSMLQEDQILRVATDQSKVSQALKHFTVDARVGGDMNDNSHLAKKARGRVNAAVIVFTTCAGAGLGLLRKVDFEFVLVDEASQITEAVALIPLVKGCKRAVLVGDQSVPNFYLICNQLITIR
jgi:superfamily I DNA and/or RNA helicase